MHGWFKMSMENIIYVCDTGQKCQGCHLKLILVLPQSSKVFQIIYLCLNSTKCTEMFFTVLMNGRLISWV